MAQAMDIADVASLAPKLANFWVSNPKMWLDRGHFLPS
jgi:hypothetical protein